MSLCELEWNLLYLSQPGVSGPSSITMTPQTSCRGDTMRYTRRRSFTDAALLTYNQSLSVICWLTLRCQADEGLYINHCAGSRESRQILRVLLALHSGRSLLRHASGREAQRRFSPANTSCYPRDALIAVSTIHQSLRHSCLCWSYHLNMLNGSQVIIFRMKE